MPVQLFSISEVDVTPPSGATTVPAFFVESTAPINFDDTETPLPTPLHTKPADIDAIVSALAQAPNPKLLITVHGYNTPRESALKTYANSFLAANDDPEVVKSGVVCVGYRWPSEAAGTPWRSALTAAPWFLIGVLGVSVAASILLSFYFALLAVVPLTLFALRWIVYFRDGYRASTYGVPDLVDLVRLIDSQLREKFDDEGRTDQRADLSFIGHSMGGFVVTNAVRVLTDVFSPEALSAMAGSVEPGSPAELAQREGRSKIGQSFLLRRLVLVSPDIPGEVLLSGRGNALESSLIRFQEAHLFSNEGDEILRNISTTANFFSLPTKKRRFGYRLGNVGVLLKEWGVSEDLTLGKLRLGVRTLYQLYAELDAAQKKDSFVQQLTFFDCTDSLDDNGNGVVTDVTKGSSPNLSWLGHLRLLWAHWNRKADTHSGYFHKPSLVRTLIYRFAAIGYGDCERAFGGPAAFSKACQIAQIKALKPGPQPANASRTSAREAVPIS
jgi:pimeloyl-ACP methyl ester carboxylesterase